MARNIALALLTVVALGNVRPLKGEDSGSGKGSIESDVLSTAFVDTLAKMVMAEKERTGELPKGATSPEFVVSHLQALEKKYPDLLMVSPDEEAAFEAGKFNDEGNKKKLAKLIEELEGRGSDLAVVQVFLIQRFKAGELVGAKLELAVRMLSADLG